MIVDHFENLKSYSVLNPLFEQAVEFLSRSDLKSLSPGKYEIDGEQVFAIVVNDAGRSRNDGVLEVHREYIDIQCVLSGTDDMGWKPKAQCFRPKSDYDPGNDAQLFDDEPDTWVSVGPNSFALFFPEDAHMAMFSPGNIHKIILKVVVAKDRKS